MDQEQVKTAGHSGLDRGLGGIYGNQEFVYVSRTFDLQAVERTWAIGNVR